MADMDEFSCVGRLENRMVNNVFRIEGRRSGIKSLKTHSVGFDRVLSNCRKESVGLTTG